MTAMPATSPLLPTLRCNSRYLCCCSLSSMFLLPATTFADASRKVDTPDALADRVLKRVRKLDRVWGNYTVDLTLDALLELYEMTGDDRYRDYVMGIMFRRNIRMEDPIPYEKQPFGHLNYRLWLATGDDRIKQPFVDETAAYRREADRAYARPLMPMNAVKPVRMSLPELNRQATEAGDGPLIDVPVLASDWWQVTEKTPDCHPYNHPTKLLHQDACDFAIWQDEAGLWHIVSCIRGVQDETKVLNRIFYEWTSDDLTRQFWDPKGIFMVPDASRGERPGAVQAPHAFKHEGKHYLFYSSSNAFALISSDGVNWDRLTDHQGNNIFFRMGRDLNIFHDQGKWFGYYTTNEVAYRTADNLRGPWSEQQYSVGSRSNPESPFVLKKNGRYYMWSQMNVYMSTTPHRFTDPIIAYTRLPEADEYDPTYRRTTYAPEIFQDRQGNWYIAGYANGIFVAKLKWVKQSPADIRQWWAQTGKDIMVGANRHTLKFYADRDTSSGWPKLAVERARQNLQWLEDAEYEFLD